MTLRAATFGAGAAVAGWVLGGYPLALAALPARPWRPDPAYAPEVTVLVPAFNEREALGVKLDGLLAASWPRERLHVVVVVDEDEGTAAVAREHPLGPEVLFTPRRSGKAAALRRGLAHVRGEVVVLTDANNVLDPGALAAAVRHLADPEVWAVAGRRGERRSAYDRYEDLLRRLETRSGTCAAASGEFLVVRADRVPAWPDGVINDDLWLLCQLVRAGGRVVYEPAAASVEDALGGRAELERRARIGAGRVLLLGELRGLPPGFAVRLVSHKMGRLALPFALLACLGSSLSLARRRGWRRIAVAQLALYAAGGAGAAGLTPPGWPGLLLRALGQFVAGNVAIGAGVVRGVRGRQAATWDPVR